MFITNYFEDVATVAKQLDKEEIEAMVDDLAQLKKQGGRLFLIGVGGSAANCSHAVNDFRKLCEIEAYTPVDNVAELSARTNDEGWETVFSSWLKGSRANERDALFIFSVGGGDVENNVSPNIVMAIDEAKKRGLHILGIVGSEGGYTKKNADRLICVPAPNKQLTTPLTESFQVVVWHCIISHPKLQVKGTKWESLQQSSSTAMV
ncbi:MAG: Phosphoheptose isomerase [Chlamydiales bacterium]|nr:Phosphoheptose isomerase [Chlamydiales bacterium]MCH9619492.1 Phosphoheptose isomerase [Chlamydiales bacterium]MCH9622296.1 Phosphoheptose isomerase [Chlamydiales bacterium]